MESELLANIKARLPELAGLLQEMGSHWEYEDPIYRFYHHSHMLPSGWAAVLCLYELR